MYQAGLRVDLVMHQAEIPGVLQSTCYVPGVLQWRVLEKSHGDEKLGSCEKTEANHHAAGEGSD